MILRLRFQTDFNLRFKRKRDVRLTCKRVWCILHRTLSIQWLCPVSSHIIAQMDLTSGFGNISFEWKLNPPNAHRSKFAKRGKREMCSFGSCQTRFEFLSQFWKSSKCLWAFRNTGANAFAKNQTRLAYEDKRDLYCMWSTARSDFQLREADSQPTNYKCGILPGRTYPFPSCCPLTCTTLLKISSYIRWNNKNLSEQRNDVTKNTSIFDFNM